MKKIVSLSCVMSIALASCLVAPTHAVVPLLNPLAAGESHSLFISNPVSNPTIVTQGFFPQNIVRGMGSYGPSAKELGSIPPSGSPPPELPFPAHRGLPRRITAATSGRLSTGARGAGGRRRGAQRCPA
jgi:hypothetical protein